MKKFILITMLIYSTALFSQNTSMNFLNITPTARQDALGITSSFYKETGAVFTNPSILRNIDEKQVVFTHNELLQQTKANFLGFVLPKEKYVMSAAILSVYSLNIEGRTGQKDFDPEYVNIYQITEPEFYYNMYSVAAGLGISKKIKSYNLGITGKFLYERIEDVSGYSIATDFGIQSSYKNMFINLAVQNFGLPIKYTQKWNMIPTKFLFGCNYKYNNISLYTEVVLPWFDMKNLTFTFAVEPTFLDSILSLRLGYRYKPYGWYLEEMYTGLSAGVGVNFLGTKLDYAVSSYGVLGFTHKATLTLEIDKLGKLYNSLREKIFGKKMLLQKVEEIHDKKVTDKVVDKLVKEIKVEHQQNVIEQEKIATFSSEEQQEIKVLTMRSNIVSIDTVNKIFVYELTLSTDIVVAEDLIIKKLILTAISRQQLPEEIEYKIYLSTQIMQPIFVSDILKKIDFTKLSLNVNITRFELQLCSDKTNLVFYSYEPQNIQRLSVEEQHGECVLYKILLTKPVCILICETR